MSVIIQSEDITKAKIVYLILNKNRRSITKSQ